MRSIAHDLGVAMGCGAHLAELRRLASGEFEIAQARTIAQLETLAAEGRLIEALVPMAQMMPGVPERVCGRYRRRADSPRPQFQRVAISFATGREVRQGGDGAGRTRGCR